MSLGEIALGILRLFLLIGYFSCLEYLLCETLELVATLSLVLSLGMKNADAIQEAFKFTRPGPVLLVASWTFHRIDRTVRFLLLVMALGRAMLICVARLLLFSSVEGHLLGQGILASDSEHLFLCPRILHGKLTDQGRVPDSLLEENDN
jgi:hypothetical protein